MNNSLVSILLPVVNLDKNNNALELLPRTIESLLLQHYTNVEFLILDNKSSKVATEICSKYSAEDTRIEYVHDTEIGGQCEALSYLSTTVKGEYSLCASAGNLYQPNFVESLLGIMEKEAPIDLLYTNFIQSETAGATAPQDLETKPRRYSGGHCVLSNLCGFMLMRNTVPFRFGLFRTAAFQQLQSVKAFDGIGADIESLQMVRFFSRGLRCEYVDSPLFSCLQKPAGLRTRLEERLKPPTKFPGLEFPIQAWLHLVQHELNFKLAVQTELELSPDFKAPELVYAKALLNDSFVLHSLGQFDQVKMEIGAEDVKSLGLVQQLQSFINTRKILLPKNEEDLAPSGYSLLASNPAYALLRLQSSTESLKVLNELVDYAAKLSEASSDVGDAIRRLCA